jgi:phosphoglycerate dehydrogenase-like enzyme
MSPAGGLTSLQTLNEALKKARGTGNRAGALASHEPLQLDNPLWRHPKVTVMPHVARRPTVVQLATEVAANIRSLEAGGALLQPIDLGMGY